MKGVVVVGASGHGREVMDIMRHQAQQDGRLKPALLGFVDDDPSLHGQIVDGLPVLGDWSWFEDVDRAAVAVICAVGLPQVCRRLVQRALDLGLQFANAISPLAHISPLARVGQGVMVFPNAVVNAGAILSDACILNIGATVSHDTQVGPCCNINPGVHLAGNVTIGEGCYVGMGANVIQGRSVGPWSVVGAGAVVIQDLPANVTAVGVPAKVIKSREEGWHER